MAENKKKKGPPDQVRLPLALKRCVEDESRRLSRVENTKVGQNDVIQRAWDAYCAAQSISKATTSALSSTEIPQLKPGPTLVTVRESEQSHPIRTDSPAPRPQVPLVLGNTLKEAEEGKAKWAGRMADLLEQVAGNQQLIEVFELLASAVRDDRAATGVSEAEEAPISQRVQAIAQGSANDDRSTAEALEKVTGDRPGDEGTGSKTG